MSTVKIKGRLSHNITIEGWRESGFAMPAADGLQRAFNELGGAVIMERPAVDTTTQWNKVFLLCTVQGELSPAQRRAVDQWNEEGFHF